MYVDDVLVTTWTSSGTTAGFESIDLSGTSGSMIEIVGVLGDSEWLSIIEVSHVFTRNQEHRTTERARGIPLYLPTATRLLGGKAVTRSPHRGESAFFPVPCC